MKELVLKNSIIGLCGVADMLGILFWSVQSILKGGLDMCQTASKFVPHLLSEEHEFVAKHKKTVIPHPTFSSD
jgi:hypothetical protein